MASPDDGLTFVELPRLQIYRLVSWTLNQVLADIKNCNTLFWPGPAALIGRQDSNPAAHQLRVPESAWRSVAAIELGATRRIDAISAANRRRLALSSHSSHQRRAPS
jgi:hypothetical protein